MNPAEASPLRKDRLPPYWLSSVVIIIAYLGVAKLGHLLAGIYGNIAPLWPASGFAVAALYIGGRRLWPAIAVAEFISNALNGTPPLAAAAMGLGDGMEAIVGAALLQLILSRRGKFGNYAELAAITSAALIAPLISATIGSSSLCLTGTLPLSAWRGVWFTWWAGNSIGSLVVIPAILAAHVTLQPRALWNSFRLKRDIPLALVVFTACYAVFLVGSGSIWLFLVFPLLLLTEAVSGPLATRLTVLAIVTFSVIATVRGLGPFPGVNQNDSLLQLQLFLSCVSITALVLSVYREVGSLLLPGGVLLAGWVLSGLLFASLQKQRLNDDNLRFEKAITDTESAITQRLNNYIDLLRGGAGFLAASERIHRSEWHDYTIALRIAEDFPAAQGIGVVLPVTAQNEANFITSLRADGAPDFTIKPVPGFAFPLSDSAGARHFVVTLCEPASVNLPALGLDLASEPNRRAGAEAARDTGEPQITGRITLVQDEKKRAAFLLFVPMYEKGQPVRTIEERRAAFRGWISAPFIYDQFIRNVPGSLDHSAGVQVFEGNSIDPIKLLYAANPAPPGTQPVLEKITHFDLAGQHFTHGWIRQSSFAHSSSSATIWASATSALGTLLLAGLVMSLQSTGRRAQQLADARTHELQDVNARLHAEIIERTRAEAATLKAKEIAEAANQAKSEFLATMSHEIRTPMNSVLGFAQLLQGTSLNREQTEWLRLLYNSGNVLLTLINDILDFSKIEAGKIDFEHIPFDPAAIARDALAGFQTQAAAKKIKMEFLGLQPPPTGCLGDPVRFRQVVVNLVNNAIKFTTVGTVKVSVTWTPQEANCGNLHVAVTDTGPGISVEQQQRLFQKFSQGDASTTREYGGTGLGLAISRSLVELMSGNIGVSSEVGHGSTFWFNLPFTWTAVAAPKLAPVPAAPIAERKLRILIAEDGELNQIVASGMLEAFGYESAIAKNGSEAVDLTVTGNFDVVLMDCQMPVMDGFEATRRIRLRETTLATPRLPIIALTANAMPNDQRKCLDAGMDAYLAKPFNKQALRTALQVATAPKV